MTAKKTIYFYSIEDENGVVLTGQAIRTIVTNLNHGVGINPYSDVDNTGNLVCTAWVTPGNTRSNVIIGKTRRSEFPRVEDGRRLSLLQLMPTQGLTDLTHITLFEDGIAAIEFNFYGPRVGLSQKYISERAGRVVCFKPLLDTAVLEKIDNIETLSKIDLKVRSAEMERINLRNMTELQAFKTVAMNTNATYIRITLGSGRSQDQSISPGFWNRLKRFFRNEDAKVFKSAVATGYSADGDKLDPVDLLNEYIVSTQEIVTLEGTSRSIDSNDMFRKIASAKRSLADELNRAING